MGVSPQSTTSNTAGNVLGSGSLAASGTATANVDASGKYGADIQVSNTGGGTVAATNGVQVDVFSRIGSGPATDTIASQTFVIPTVVSTAALVTVHVPTGRWQFKLTNLDVTNAVTASITDDTVDSIG